MKTIGDIILCFIFFFMPIIMTKKSVRNAHDMANKMVTNEYKGKSITLMGILVSFMLIRILMEPSHVNGVLMAIMIV